MAMPERSMTRSIALFAVIVPATTLRMPPAPRSQSTTSDHAVDPRPRPQTARSPIRIETSASRLGRSMYAATLPT